MWTPVSSGTPLFISGTPASESAAAPLFVQADPVPSISYEMTLTVFGTVGSGFAGGIPLFTFAGSGSNELSAQMPLFVSGPGSALAVRNMNLWVGGSLYGAEGGIDLFVANSQSGIYESVPMYVSGEGLNPGWLPFDASMNLVLGRAPAAALSLFLQAPGTPIESGVPLWTNGTDIVYDSVTLAMPEVIGTCANGAKLFTSGW